MSTHLHRVALRDVRPKSRVPRVAALPRRGLAAGFADGHCPRMSLLERVILRGYSRDHEARRTILLRRWHGKSAA
jgi:hypothetical protein